MRRRMMMAGEGFLPKGYTQLEYLRSNFGEIIIYPEELDQKDTELHTELNLLSGANGGGITGIYSEDGWCKIVSFINNQYCAQSSMTTWTNNYIYLGKDGTMTGFYTEGVRIYSVSEGGLSIGGVLQNFSKQSKVINFRVIKDSMDALISFWRIRIPDTQKYSYELIPCVRDIDGKVGFYDRNKHISPQTGTPFWISQNAKDFIAGPIKR